MVNLGVYVRGTRTGSVRTRPGEKFALTENVWRGSPWKEEFFFLAAVRKKARHVAQTLAAIEEARGTLSCLRRYGVPCVLIPCAAATSFRRGFWAEDGARRRVEQYFKRNKMTAFSGKAFAVALLHSWAAEAGVVSPNIRRHLLPPWLTFPYNPLVAPWFGIV